MGDTARMGSMGDMVHTGSTDDTARMGSTGGTVRMGSTDDTARMDGRARIQSNPCIRGNRRSQSNRSAVGLKPPSR